MNRRNRPARFARLHSSVRGVIESLERRVLMAASQEPYVLPQKFLSEPGGTLTGSSAGAPLEIAMRYLSSHAKDLGLGWSDLANPIVTDQYIDADTGLTHIYLQQRVGGLPVDNTSINLNITRSGAVLSVGGAFVANVNKKLSALPAGPALPRRYSLQALSKLGLSVPADNRIAESSFGEGTEFKVSTVSLDPIRPQLHYVATAKGLALSWQMQVRTPDRQHWYDAHVDALGGGMLWANDWVDHAAYNVLPMPVEAPNDGSRALVSNPADPVASPFGWHDTNGVAGAEYTDTRGNNVSAQEDTDANNSGGFRPDGTAALNFDFPLDLNASPSTYQSAAITNLFYWNNLLHDVHYQYGFNEASGNFQTLNYSGQGLGGDAVQADAQDGSGTNNANFASPPDGQAPRMQMYLFNYTSPGRDGDLANEIMTHEFGHGVSNRLTGGPANANALSATQSGGMGEGWSDWWALMFTQDPTDTKMASYGQGTYVLGQSSSGAGIRRFPYSFDMTKDPLTIANYGTSGTGGGTTRSIEVHNVGELWCTALWDMNWLLIDKYGYSPTISQGYDPLVSGKNGGNNLAMQLVMDGLKLQPANPSFLQARDAILQADFVRSGGANFYQIWSAFARRGMGYSFVDSSSSATSVTPAFDLPPSLLSPAVISQSPSAVSTSPVSSLDITFSKAMDTSSFDIAADVNSFTGPGAVNLKSTITSYNWTNSNQTLHLSFTPQTADGLYALNLGPQILAASDGHAMDQNGNGTPGEAGDTYTATFRCDSLLGQVISTLPANGTLVSLPLTNLEVNFNEPFDPSTLSAADLTVSQGAVSSVTAIDADTARFSLSGVVTEGTLTLNIAAGALTDLFGNPMAAYSGTLALDADTVPFPTPLSARGAGGMLIYDGSTSASIGANDDVDTFTLSLDAGQLLTLCVDPASSLQPLVVLRDPSNNVIGTSSANGAGLNALLQTVPIGAAGTYSITVASVGGASKGAFSLKATLNSALESESHDGPSNDTPATAQNLDPAFGAPVAGSIGSIASVLGTAPAPTGNVILSEGFESGALGPAWSTYQSDVGGRIQVTSSQGAASGSYALLMDTTSSTNAYNLNEAVWTVDLSGATLPTLTFSTRSWADETNAMPTDFTGHFNGDGVAISDNGTNWHTIWTNSSPTVWTSVSVNLATAASAAGMTLGPGFKIKFQQYDNFALTTDGRGYDAISVSVPAGAADYYSFSATAGQSLAVAGKVLPGSSAHLALDLFDSNGVAVAHGSAAATNLDALIANFTAPSSGVYYAKVTSDLGADYALTVTKDLGIDAESNDTPALAQPIGTHEVSGQRQLIGYLEPAVAASQTINFGEISPGVVNGATIKGVQFKFQVGGVDSTDATFGTNSGPGTLTYVAPPLIEGNTAGILTMTLPSACVNFSFGVALSTTGTISNAVVVQLFNGSTLVSTVPLTTTSRISFTEGLFVYSDANAPITKAVLDFNELATSRFVVDNVTFSGQAGISVDSYSLPLKAGEVVTLGTMTPGEGGGEFVNRLNPALELCDPSGNRVAFDDNGSQDGKNASISYTAPAPGNYVVRVLSSASSSFPGEYVLSLSGSGFTLTVPANVQENAGSATGTLAVFPVPTSDLVVSLISSDPSRLTVPQTVTIPAGQSSIPLPITLLDNNELDGSEQIIVAAMANGFGTGTTTTTVHDDETAILTIDLPQSAAEGGPALSGTITSSMAPTRDILVQLTSSNGSRATVPATVTLPAGQTSVAFQVTVVDNATIDDNTPVTISAAVDNWTGDSSSIGIADNDAYLSVILPTGAWEGQTLNGAGTVRLGGTLTTPLVVQLLSSDSTELDVPVKVTIPAGQLSATFAMTFLTDGIKDGAQSVSVSGSAIGLAGGSSNTVVHDADLDRISFDPIAGPRNAAVAFAVTAKAFNVDDEAIAVFSGSGALTVTGESGATLPATPASLSFVSGVANGNVVINTMDPAAMLTLTAGGVSGSSNAFVVQSGPIASLSWDYISSPQFTDSPIDVKITAKDAYGYPALGFNGVVNLSGLSGTILSSQTMLGNARHTSSSGGTSVYTDGFSFVPSSKVVVTHVRSYFGTKVSIWTDSGALLASQPVTGTPGGWTETALATPITLQAGSTYRIGAYLPSGQSYACNPLPTVSTIGTIKQWMYSMSDSMPTVPIASWILVDLRGDVGEIVSVPIDQTSVTFVNGQWTGSLKVLQPATGFYFKADDGAGHIASSSPFDVFQRVLDLTLPANLAENNSGSPSGTLSVSLAANTDLTVSLNSSNPSRFSVPATVTIPAGQTSVAVPLSVLDNSLLDGSEAITVTAVTAGAVSDSATVTIHDDETASLSVSLPASANEGDGTIAGMITSSAAPSRDIIISLSSSNTSLGTVPLTVTLPAGQTSAVFNVALTDNTTINTPQSVTITASVENWTSGAATVSVADNDTYLTITLPAGGWEGQTLSGIGTVRLGGTTATTRVINLSSSDTTELTVPATVTVLAGHSSVTFNVTLLSDGLKDGGQVVHVTGSTPGLTDGASGDFVVHDAELDHLSIDPIASPKTAGVGFAQTATACNIDNEVIVVYSATAQWTASGQSGSLPVTPASVSLSSGAWSGMVAVNGVDPNVAIKLTAAGKTVTSNTFAVQPGPLTGFRWGAMPSQVLANAPFNASLTAIDANGYTVTGFSGSLNLTGRNGSAASSKTILTAATADKSGNTGTYTFGYSFTPSQNIEVTHLRSYFGSKVSIWTDTGTLLVSKTVSGPAGSWTETPLSSPIVLLAGVTYRIGAYTAGATYYWRTDISTVSPIGTIVQSLFSPGDTCPTGGSSTKYAFVDLRGNLGVVSPVAVSPASLSLVSGTWAGNVVLSETGPGIYLRADDGAGHTVDSAAFNVYGAPLAPVLMASSDTGSSNSDRITCLNNSTPDKTLQFSVGGTMTGATVNLYAGLALIGSAVASGATTIVTTNGSAMVGEGDVVITARQAIGAIESVESPGTTITVDCTAPALSTLVFDPMTRHAVNFDASETLASLDVSALVLQNLTLTQNVPATSLAVQHDANHYTLLFPGLPGSMLADGNYVLTFPAASMSDVAGNAAADDTSLSFFVLGGDANRDRIVDINDLGILGLNWQGNGRVFSQGDFNYDGKVDARDLGILSANWQRSLPVPVPPPPLTKINRVPSRTAVRAIDMIDP